MKKTWLFAMALGAFLFVQVSRVAGTPPAFVARLDFNGNTVWGMPEGALGRLGRGNIRDVVFSSDGSKLAVVSGIGTWIYDAHSGAELCLIPGAIGRGAFSPDGSTLASARSDGTAHLWDLASGEIQADLGDYEGSWSTWVHVRSIGFSPDGFTLAIATGSGLITLWDVASKQIRVTIKDHLHWGDYLPWYLTAAFSPDGSTLASGSDAVRLWDVATGELKAVLGGQGNLVSAVAFSPDGSTLASASDAMRLWDVATGQLKDTLEGAPEFLPYLWYLPDGATLVGGGSDWAGLWDVTRRKIKGTLEGYGRVWAAALSPDGTLASGNLDGTVRLWDSASGQLKDTLGGYSYPVEDMSYRVWGQSGSHEIVYRGYDNYVWIWEVFTGQPPGLFKGHEGGVNSMACGPSGLLAMGGFDGAVWLWSGASMGSPSAILREEGSGSISSLAFSPDGSTLASGSARDRIRLWDTTSGQLKAAFGGYADESLAWSPDGSTLAGLSDYGTITLWDTDSWQPKVWIDLYESFSISSMAFSPDGSNLASGGFDGTIRLWDTESGQLKATFQGPAGEGFSLAFSPDGSTLASGSSKDNTVRLWDTESGQIKATLEGHMNHVTSVVFLPDGPIPILASGSRDGTILLWDLSPYSIPTATEEETEVPFLLSRTSLEANYPNPFNSSTYIPYRLAGSGPVRLVIFNTIGQPVRTLVDELQAAGVYQVQWDGRDGRGERVATGVYLYRLQEGPVARVRKMLVQE